MNTRFGCIGATVVLAVLLIAMFATCPKPYEHRRVIQEVVREAVDERLGSSQDMVQALMMWAGKKVIGIGSDLAIDQLVTVDNYYVVSVGKIDWQGKERIVSVGLLGHVFTADKDDVIALMKKNGF